MLLVKYSNEVRLKNGQIYSLDMVRLTLEFYEDEMQTFLDWLSQYNLYGDEIDVKHWLSTSEFKYRDMFNVVTPDYSFALGVGMNARREDRYKGYIEFNPNKCQGEAFSAVWNRIVTHCLRSDVARYDLAIDIPLPRYLCRLGQPGKMTYHHYRKNGVDTEYLGERNHVGFVKLYDKKAESKLDYDLTRLEITCETMNFKWPEVNILPLQNELNFAELSDTEKVLIQLLKVVGDQSLYLKQLQYRKRKKIEPYLWADTVQLDETAYFEILKQVKSYIFPSVL